MAKKKCNFNCIAKVLLVIGGLNLGVIGAGMLSGNEWDLLNSLLGSWPTVEGLVYLVVGLCALWIGKACCMACKDGKCS
jgi:uncharacterized membrane protein YuzA (DUF378 family)